jgi:hypothetical protein
LHAGLANIGNIQAQIDSQRQQIDQAKDRRKHVCHYELPRRQCHRAADFGLVVDRDRPQALLHDLRSDFCLCIAALRFRMKPAGAGAVPHPAGTSRWRHGDQRAGNPCRFIPAREARIGVCDLRHRRRCRAGRRFNLGRLDQRHLFLALGLSHQCAGWPREVVTPPTARKYRPQRSEQHCRKRVQESLHLVEELSPSSNASSDLTIFFFCTRPPTR